jgi:spore maturation protein CgeB
LFEAAACGVPIITDDWPGLETFFRPLSEILPVPSDAQITSYLQMPADQRLEVGERARRRTLHYHTAAVRAEEFETHVLASLERASCSKKRSRASLKQSTAAALI